jgi:hypothetical protein
MLSLRNWVSYYYQGGRLLCNRKEGGDKGRDGVLMPGGRGRGMDGLKGGFAIILMTAAEEVYTERVYIDPERLLKLKKERRSLKLVPSVFEPPADEAPSDPTTAHDSSVPSLKARSGPSRDNNLSA